jgi:site-specific DNA-methyltransferase (adenine-specific)
VLRLDGHLYIFCDHNVLPVLCNWTREAQGDHRFGECHPLVWDKINMGMGYHYRGQYENILFAWREPREGVGGFKKRRLNDLGIPDVLRCKRVTGGYPTEKPEEIVRILVNQSVRPFVTNQNDKPEVICDPFAGSGVLGAVAPAHCRVLLNDKSPQAIAHINRRLARPANVSLFAGQPTQAEANHESKRAN